MVIFRFSFLEFCFACFVWFLLKSKCDSVGHQWGLEMEDSVSLSMCACAHKLKIQKKNSIENIGRRGEKKAIKLSF